MLIYPVTAAAKNFASRSPLTDTTKHHLAERCMASNAKKRVSYFPTIMIASGLHSEPDVLGANMTAIQPTAPSLHRAMAIIWAFGFGSLAREAAGLDENWPVRRSGQRKEITDGRVGASPC